MHVGSSGVAVVLCDFGAEIQDSIKTIYYLAT